jgi:dGTPase
MWEEVYRASNLLARSSYHRTQFTSDLIGRFVRSVNVRRVGEDPAFWQVRPNVGEFAAIETLKAICMNLLIRTDKFLAEKSRSRHIITCIFEALQDSGRDLLPDDWKIIYDHYRDDVTLRNRTICDFISGMTNLYCVEFYERLFSVRPPSIHKP